MSAATFITVDPYKLTNSPITLTYPPAALPVQIHAQKLIPMKSTEHVSNERTYASIQSQQELSRLVTNESAAGKRNPKELIYVRQTASTAVGGHPTTTITKTATETIKSNSLDCERIKWNPSLGGQNTTVLATNTSTVVETVQSKSIDWLLSVKPTLYPELPANGTRSIPTAAMSVTINSEQHQQSQRQIRVENVSKPKLNHSSDAKVTSETTLSFNERLKTEPKQLITSSPVNGNDGPATATDNNTHESLHKSITNHSTVGNSSLSSTKLNESSKGRKQLLSERRQLKQNKSEAKSIREKKQKCANGGKSVGSTGRKSAAAAQHDSLSSSRFPVKCSENGTFGSASSMQPQQQQQPNNAERFSGKRMDKEWHSPESYIYDDISSDTIADSTEYTTCMQTFWFRDIPNENLLTREQRMENKRDNLRRQAFQYAQAQHFRSTMLAKRRLITVTKALAKFKNERNKASPTKCSVQACSNAALAMTAYCYLHITLNKDQKLFHPCTAKFSDNSQCRVPVFDISHELPLCREHAWKRDNYNRILQEQKPKKSIKTKTKSIEPVRQPKRNKKKKRRNTQLVLTEPTQMIPKQQLKQAIGQLNANVVANNACINPTTVSAATTKQSIQPMINVVWNQDLFRKHHSGGETPQIISAKSPALMTSMNKYLPDNVMVYQLSNSMPNAQKIKIQNIITVGENSSAYESSEDTGVGELSESELITAQDGIEIPLGDARLLEEHDLTNVLNQLPVDAFNDLFQVQQHDHYEPTQKEQDELARALEEVDEQVKSLEQMTSSSNFLDNFLDVNDEILDGSDICDEVLTTSSVKNDIRGLVHT
ncbi:uncharacterized protein LOC129575353 isoform X2 [Sitodiplosis mosellana]|uniref:uncharacterized protein LOC129575353 isoform X2 n=1 Tax=Sitodiplosis mosellana TaxID=263140 RepID=UPI0024440DF0|nr:uncharacterized protein LOC129575353 isoform X2 [Sitodiplosis mosellana]XP_055314804.1 uncharacterized protein LOC129575353 isoform X2 [Sitodiplosis mosellana]XP_055314805.1 uncharacterized protein LOC129575353 isoform X2 [Sitodiplosis mosellana]XP_055314806.1 uncharacterized protein LOC129575353 isoform X2 [Sitodiplosis mosellana]